MTTKRRPAENFHPGEHLLEEMDERKWTPSELAAKLEWPLDEVHGVLAGERDITQAFAVRLRGVLGTSAEMWLRLQDAWYEWRRVTG